MWQDASYFFDMTFSVLMFKISISFKIACLFPVLMDQLKLKMADSKIYSPLISNLLCFLINSYLHWFETSKGTTEQGKNFGLDSYDVSGTCFYILEWYSVIQSVIHALEFPFLIFVPVDDICREQFHFMEFGLLD